MNNILNILKSINIIMLSTSVMLNKQNKITVPLNIWKLDAKVIVRPMYMSVVAIISNIAGMKNKNGLNCWLPLTIGLSSMGYCKKKL